MLSKQSSNSLATLFLVLAAIGVALVAGFFAGANPQYLYLALLAVPVLVLFFTKFEQTVLGLLVLRSALDAFSAQQIPAAFAIALDGLTILYVTVQLLTGKPVRTDRFWWLLIAWVFVQGLWVILLPLGGLGLDGFFVSEAIREWVRLVTWAFVYLLVMQLKGRIPPEKVILALFLSLILPITVALMQMFFRSLLPPMLVGGVSRIRGTFGMANTFTTFLLLFIGLAWWQMKNANRRWYWLALIGLLAFFFVATKSLFGLMMLAAFLLVLIAPNLNLLNLIAGILLFAIIIGLFVSSPFGQERLASIAETPLLNPDMDISRAILLSQGDHNSFNWRLAQWNLLLNRWQEYPILGYGLGLSIQVADNQLLPHNDYVRALVEGGIIGFVSFIGFFVAQFVRLVQLIKHSPIKSSQRSFCFILLAILVSIPVGMLTENIWSHSTLFFYWFTVLAVAGWDWNKEKTSENNAVMKSRF